MEKELVNYYLVLEARPGDFMPIDINILLGNEINQVYTTMESIDAFTKMFSLEEIYEMIRRSNIVPNYYLEGVLEIINDNKYRYEVITKENTFSLDLFLADYIDDKIIMNKFLNIYLKYYKDNIFRIKNAIVNKDIDLIIDILYELPYESLRGIYLYIEKTIVDIEEKRVLKQIEKAA